ncbi:hypothetical protein JZ751_011901 [Albula glossodonta]|uniref:Occludin n=1 Tax=Albula glossodonta TaxID=121402 RepID=A0A8T2PR29_9TELE|nr:hypothetical protein JZ751_011901 [Albula glossodonta]
MSSKPNGSPPPYADNGFHGSRELYDADVPAQPAYSYYPDDEFLHFYRWTSPPGVIKIISVILIVLCVAIFACVASTLAWDTQMGLSGFGGIGSGYGGSYGSYGGGYGTGTGSFGGYGGAYGAGNAYGYGSIGGNYNDPRKGKGFMIAMAAICFIAVMVIFILVVSRQSISRSRRFYLAVIIICAILAFLMLIATIVYLVAVNPMAQSSGSIAYTQIQGLCAQYQTTQPSGVFVNQYLYHYCVVEPQEAIAIVFGFLVTLGLIIMLIFAVKTRQKIGSYGKENILWQRVKMVEEVQPNGVEEWVNNVSGVPEVLSEFPEKLGGSRSHLDDNSTDYAKPPYDYTPEPPAEDIPLRNMAPYSSGSEMTSSVGKPPKRRARRPRRADGQDYDTDYNTGGESADELDDNDFDREFPPIVNEQERAEYKREFDRDHQEYKGLQAELDDINKSLSAVDRELDNLEDGSPEFLDAMDEYNRLRNLKKSADYQMKKRRCKYLKGKLSHIKKRVSDFDRS